MATHGLPAWPWAAHLAEALPPPEGLLLEGMRLWAAAAREGRPPLPALRAPFVAEDAAAAIPAFDALLRGAAALRPMGFAAPLCPLVVEEEARLLLGCALAQRGAPREALAAFLRWLPMAGAAEALAQATGFGLALRGAGLLLRNPLRRPGSALTRPCGAGRVRAW